MKTSLLSVAVARLRREAGSRSGFPFVSDPEMVRQVVVLAWPAVVEQLLNTSVGLVDAYLVGHLGAAALAGVGLSAQVMMLNWALFASVGVGATALVARYVGAGRPAEASRTATQALLLALAVGLGVGALLFAGAPLILRLLGGAPEVVAEGTPYLRTVAASVGLMAVLFVGNAVLRGAGDTRTPMLVMFLINAVNIAVASSLVYGVGPLPALGVVGSGLGAATARSLGGLVVLGILVQGRAGLRLALGGPGRRLPLPRPDGGRMVQVLRIGLPAGGEQLLMRVAQVVMATLVTRLGTASYAAHQLVIQVMAISYMPGWGFALAATTLVGQELGAGRPDRATRSGYTALGLAVGVMVLVGGLLFAFAEHVVAFFTRDAAVIRLGAQAMRVAAFYQPFLSGLMVLGGGLRGAGDTRTPLLIQGGTIWLVRLPLVYLFGLVLGWDVVGVHLAMGVDFGVRAFLFERRFRSGKWQTVLKT